VSNADVCNNGGITSFSYTYMENTRLSKVGAGVALSVSLLVAFVLCSLAQIVLPGAQFSHMWPALFTGAPAGSVAAWIGGSISSVVVGFVAGYCFAHCYNWMAARK
jgi:hypothetical protein